MYHTFALSDMMRLVMFVKYFKTYCKYSKHVHPQTKEPEGTHQAEFPELGSGAGICSHLASWDGKAQKWRVRLCFLLPFLLDFVKHESYLIDHQLLAL